MPIHVKNERFRRVWKPFRPLSGQMASRGWIWAWEDFFCRKGLHFCRPERVRRAFSGEGVAFSTPFLAKGLYF